ncbi:MAG: ribonuclease III [Proteobacteria bacterium]|nr:ribonuclease III [Pseudomonadota bacterium]
MDPLNYFLSFYPDMPPTFDVIKERIGYSFKNKNLLIEALTHRSAIQEVKHRIYQQTDLDMLEQIPWNEKLEFLGDSVLSLGITTWLWYKGNLTCEGDLSKARSALVQESVLVLVARQLDLGSFIILGAATEKAGGRQRISILADALEALIGAIYLDGGFEVCYFITEKLFMPYIKKHLNEEVFADHKTRLQEVIQQTYGEPPDYQVVNSHGPDHNKQFVVECRIKGKLLAQGEGKSKKKASQIAAAKALKSTQLSSL